MHTVKSSVASDWKSFAVIFACLVSLLGTASCRDPGDQTTTDSFQLAPTSKAAEVPTRPQPAKSPTSRAPQATRTPIPSKTPVPVVIVYSPTEWLTSLEKSISQLSFSADGAEWRIDDDELSADLVISNQEGGLLAGYRPIFLTVPWTSVWEAVSLEEANNILAFGHPLVEVKDLAELSPERKVLKVDDIHAFDSDYPLTKSWYVSYRQGYGQAAEKLADQLRQEDPLAGIVLVAAVGDIMLDRALGYALSNGQIQFPFDRVSELLSTANFTLGNLESSLGDLGEPVGKSYTFQAPPEAADSLAAAGFDLVSLANNHAMDFGPAALAQAVDLLKNKGIEPVGAGSNRDSARKPYIFDQNGQKTAFLAYVDVPVEGSGFDTQTWRAGPESPGVNWASIGQITKDVASATLAVDNTVVILHSGYEYVEQPSPNQINAARTAIDAGADLVIGHHSHVLQGIEFRNGGVIVYGLGNFAFEIDGDPSTALLYVWLDNQGVRQIELVPAIIQFGGQPRLATSTERAEILARIYHLTDLLNESMEP